MAIDCELDFDRADPFHSAPPVRVLVVDDDSKVIDGMKRCLKRYNIEVIEGYHGVHGIWRTITERPDIIITDICMPLVNGEEVVRCLRNNQTTSSSPIIVLTGLEESHWKKKMLGLGVDAYFTKPVDSEELVQVIASLVPQSLARNA
ncbi:response regulator [Aeoliella mucimassa]|uniref:Response regulator MprA n=1 Tax=Aeoliella mucimassa TaxID=2527972 RepID=A0A518AHF2_9BACT|nr:response regulator [Aeoliella mucimassa]QDU54168.1 Response regulator MprA [Aeoliella mucimassa]